MLQEMLKLFYFGIYFILSHMCGRHEDETFSIKGTLMVPGSCH